MPEPDDDWEPEEFTSAICRPVTLDSGETIPVLGDRPLSPEGVAALAEVVEAARREHAADNPPAPGSGELYERIETARGPLNWRQVAAEAGVKFSTLFRIGQGYLPGPDDLAAIEAWLTRTEATDDTCEEH